MSEHFEECSFWSGAYNFLEKAFTKYCDEKGVPLSQATLSDVLSFAYVQKTVCERQQNVVAEVGR